MVKKKSDAFKRRPLLSSGETLTRMYAHANTHAGSSFALPELLGFNGSLWEEFRQCVKGTDFQKDSITRAGIFSDVLILGEREL